MITLLLIFVVIMDLFLIGLVYFMSKQKFNPVELLKEISQERRQLKEIRESIQLDLNQKYHEVEALYKKINTIAAEAEMEVKNSSATLSSEMATILDEFSQKLITSGEKISRQKASLGSVIQKAQKERELLKKNLLRSERLSKFFSSKIPYEEVLEEIEDKKYLDARHLLSKGLSAKEVSCEVGLSESEVALIAAIR